MSIFNHFHHLNLSDDQINALTKLEDFINSPDQVFMLKGYAGSGKTTIMKGFTEYLNSIEKEFILMAPTGRASNVLKNKTNNEVLTIHKTIYSFDNIAVIEENDSYRYYYKIRNENEIYGKIFIIDEASMISNAKNENEFFSFGTGHLLSDLITYTKITQTYLNNKIIFVGDPCQLPPVGDNSSKAFDGKFLKEKFNLNSVEIEMKEVKRQGNESEILNTASKIRKSISSNYFNDFNIPSNGIDIINTSNENFIEEWVNSSNSKIIIASKNKTCNTINSEIRKIRFGKENAEIQNGDIVIIGNNNYRKDIFNGEFAVVNNVSKEITQRTIPLKSKNPVTLYWRDIELIFQDSGNNKVVKGKILENFLKGENQLKPEETQALYVDFIYRHNNLKPNTKEFKEKILNDEYFNCILLKYGYAVTCHKSQGGEWENVFCVWDHDNTIGFNYYNDKQTKSGKTNKDFYRWSYTAITRASKKLYAINPPFFNSYSNLTFLDLTAIESLNEINNNESPVDIIINDKTIELLTKHQLLSEPLSIQNQFLKIEYSINNFDIELFGWEKVGFEIRYKFKIGKEIIICRTYINGKNEFNKPITLLNNKLNKTKSEEQLLKLLNKITSYNIIRNDSVEGKDIIEINSEIEEKYPFAKYLYDDINIILNTTKIKIGNIEHLQYKERYTFYRNTEKVTLDFEYNSNGFFGRVLPIKKATNSFQLYLDIQYILKKLNSN